MRGFGRDFDRGANQFVVVTVLQVDSGAATDSAGHFAPAAVFDGGSVL